MSGRVKIYLQDIGDYTANQKLVGMELTEGDYIDPQRNLNSFDTKRLKSINQRIRE